MRLLLESSPSRGKRIGGLRDISEDACKTYLGIDRSRIYVVLYYYEGRSRPLG